jgi:hypothetical protein
VDSLSGLGGSDTYFVDQRRPGVQAAGGTDTVFSGGGFTYAN